MPTSYTADQVVARLGITKKSLYAYVSRGRIRTTHKQGRRKHYNAQDVDALWRAQQERHNPERVAKQALDWHGHPVLPTALCTVGPHTLTYRDRPIDALIEDQSMSFEQVAALLWWDDHTAIVDFAHPLPQSVRALPAWPQLTPLKRTQLHWAMAEHADLGAYRFEPQPVGQTGAKLVNLMLCAAGATGGTSAAHRLALSIHAPQHTRLIEVALILCAEHGLNASTFAARVTASTKASIYGVCSSGLAALMGQHHAGTTLRIGAWIDDIMRAPSLRQGVVQRLRRGAAWPGLGHKLYPEGDPRARILWRQIQHTLPPHTWQPYADLFATLKEVPDAGEPSIDLMLVVLMRALGRHDEDALTLFGLGRCVGWIAHAIEQYARREVIRPRAQYTSPT